MTKQFVGLLKPYGKDGVVQLDKADSEIGREIIVPEKHLRGAPFGMKVVVELSGKGIDHAYGKIAEVLGDPARPDVAIHGIMRQYGLTDAFPADVLSETKPLPADLSPDAVAEALDEGYRDLRGLNTITIDGEDAKDIDDAIDIERLENGRYRLYVHIADVAHYVRPGSALDKEALRRGNSIYLVDRVLPMLPPKLSNGLCSLNPGVPRRAMTCDMVIDGQGRVVSYELYESVIESKVRASYNEVKLLLEDNQAEFERPEWFPHVLKDMRELADILEKKRVDRGMLEFNFPETKVEMDTEGHPIAIYPSPLSFANEIIEEFMIVANETVALHLTEKNVPGIYRVHEDPDPERLFAFSRLASQLGLSLRAREGITPKALSQVLRQLKGKKFEQTLSMLLLRSLAKADYRPENEGHFGLASEHYLHFTAPIRRYADLIVHRSLKASFAKTRLGITNQQLAEIASHISDTERIAVAAERDTVDQKAAEYYQDKIGEEYEGTVSGFSKSALFVQLENTVEGAIFYRTLDGYFQYSEERLSAENGRGNTIHIGDAVTVRVASVDINRRFLDFALVRHSEARSKEEAKSIPQKSREKEAKRLSKMHKRQDKRRSR